MLSCKHPPDKLLDHYDEIDIFFEQLVIQEHLPQDLLSRNWLDPLAWPYLQSTGCDVLSVERFELAFAELGVYFNLVLVLWRTVSLALTH
jgi:hypothetical protein